MEEIISAVARRKPVNPEVADAIVASLDIPAISTLLANPDAKVREKAMDSIVEQAEKIEEFQQPLTMRTDLSKRAIWRLASFVGASLIEQLMMRYGLDEDIKHQLNKELRARLQEDSQKESTPLDKAKKDVAAALAAGKLDEAFVDRCANAGQRDAVVLSLAALAKVPEVIVRKIIQSGSAKPAIALVWHARTFHAGSVQDPELCDEAECQRIAARPLGCAFSHDGRRDALAPGLFRRRPVAGRNQPGLTDMGGIA